MSVSIEHQEQTKIRIIVAFEDEFHAYQGTLAAAIRILRPDSEVVTAVLKELGGVAKRFGPDIVIGGRFKDAEVEGVPAWIRLSLDPSQATTVRVEGKYSEMINPTLDKLLVVIEEVAQTLGRATTDITD